MTRWARTNNTHSKKALDATPWEDMKNSSSGTTATNKKQSPLRNLQGKKKNKKKKDYLNEDVNGFMEYLKQNSQLRNGKVIDSHKGKEEIATALKKDQRRETRRLKRQDIKNSSMVRLSLIPPPPLDSATFHPLFPII
ncbi:PREDICTED: zinc finger CCHC domain-containing protein 9-like [Gekko japonicus]|uniref:Zinc finger CCHC domain-containing protein 9-like n=1 Tax=Gekko japonicus TaxID=146911 RepID=A0ABM1LDY0_GEKJA|nr:PREDICTED: zinc finger CCHC domain-containing protein 9-like [Gekko japonicus]